MQLNEIVTVEVADLKALCCEAKGESGSFICGDNCSCGCESCSNCDTVCANSCDYSPSPAFGRFADHMGAVAMA